MMRRLFLVVVASFSLSGTAAVAGVTASPAVAATQTICSNQAVPAGWVVTRVATGGACGTNCGVHGAPAGWVIVQTVSTSSSCQTSTASWASHRIRRT